MLVLRESDFGGVGGNIIAPVDGGSMIKLSRSAGYAFLVLGYLAGSDVDGPVLGKTLSDHFGIPGDYLLKVLRKLVRAGLLDSVRGPNGGFLLLRPISEISVLDVVEAMGQGSSGDFDLSSCGRFGEGGYHRRLADMYGRARQQTLDLFGGTTLNELLDGAE
jgi:Rrf2 family protein